MNKPILICTDLDRTLIPNGSQTESPQARPLFAHIAQRSDVRIAYVTGRHLQIVEQAISDYHLPQPDYILADVGTSIYIKSEHGWQLWQAWSDEIEPCWNGFKHDQLIPLFADFTSLLLQEPEKQNQFKLSYYVPLTVNYESLVKGMQAVCHKRGVRAGIIWSVDEPKHIGLLDIIPETATKLHAIEYLMEKEDFTVDTTMFAGDSGNDLAVLVSRIQAVVVANANEVIKKMALSESRVNHTSDAIYIAKGDFLGMNGNYSAGLLEGLAHYFPETREWLETR